MGHVRICGSLGWVTVRGYPAQANPVTTQTGISLGWEDIRDLREGAATRRITDDPSSVAPPSAKSCTMPPSTVATGSTTAATRGMHLNTKEQKGKLKCSTSRMHRKKN